MGTPSKSATHIQPPVEAGEADDVTRSLNVAAYGLEEAMAEFDDHFTEATVNLPHPLKRCVGDPTVFTRKKSSVIFSRHVDDALTVGTERHLDTFFAELDSVFAIKVSPPIEEEEQQHLGVMTKRTKDGFNVRNRDE